MNIITDWHNSSNSPIIGYREKMEISVEKDGGITIKKIAESRIEQFANALFDLFKSNKNPLTHCQETINFQLPNEVKLKIENCFNTTVQNYEYNEINKLVGNDTDFDVIKDKITHFYEGLIQNRSPGPDRVEPISENKEIHATAENVYRELMGVEFSDDMASDLQYLVFDGILVPAKENDIKTVLFNLNELQDDSPENLYAVLKATQKIAENEKNLDLLEHINKKIKEEEAQVKELSTQFIDKPLPKEESKPEPSSVERMLKCALIGTLLIGSGLIYYKQMSAYPKSHASSPDQHPEDLCQLSEMSDICRGNLGISRIDMPQVDGWAKESFLKCQNVTVVRTSVPAAKLIPVQSEMNYHKVMRMVTEAKENKYNPCAGEILVANTMNASGKASLYVIDGHHRYAACRLIGGDQEIVRIDDTAQNILADLNNFPGVTKEKL